MLPIPQFEQETFNRNRSILKTVVCQLRYSDILAITADTPAAFQNKVRRSFPKFDRQNSFVVALVDGKPAPQPAGTFWRFATDDEAYILSLADGAIGLEARKYTNFQDFEPHLNLAIEALNEVYEPKEFTRVGLRYINEIVRIKPHSGELDWSEWVNPDLMTSVVVKRQMGDALSAAVNVLVIDEHNARTTFRYGLAKGLAGDKPAEALTLDFDRYTDKPVNIPAVGDLLRSYNISLFNLFRWSIGRNLLAYLRETNTTTAGEIIHGASIR